MKKVLKAMEFGNHLHNVCAVHQGIVSTLGDIIEYTGGVQYTGGYHSVHRGVFSTLGGYHSVHRGVFSTVGGYHEYSSWYHDECGDIISTPGDVQYTGVSIQIQLFAHWASPTFIMISPHCTHDIRPVHWDPPLYCTPPGVLHRHYAGW